jgi:RimJ/RimL family protein N-acetyltransferase
MSIMNLFKGKQVKLTTLREEDIPVIEKWYNDMNFLRHFDKLIAVPRDCTYIGNFIKEMNNANDEFIFAIRSLEDDKLIGVTGFENIQWNNRVATIFIGIGENGYRGKGIGKEAMSLTIDYAFNELNLHKLQLTVLQYNTAAIGLYESLGFIKEGVFREFILRDKTRYDLINYGIIDYEWVNKSL